MNICTQLWGYSKLGCKLHSLYNEYKNHETIDTDRGHLLIDSIQTNIIECGAICIKFCQWLLPILDNIYIKEEKPYWFESLENLYENCPIHDQEYSKEVYTTEFGENFDDDYTIQSVIGSGSIGQVYKIQNKHTDKIFAFKIIHPHVKYQLRLFKKILRIILWIPCLSKKLYSLVPVDYMQFIGNFEEQINMIKEANNLLRMNYNYQDNPSVIIPHLIRCSESCLVMTFEDGTTMDHLDLSGYQKTKIISLLYGFVSSNQLFDDIMHNDIHKANWKVRKITANRYAIVIYDFGYCYRKRLKDRPIIRMITDTFETTDENTDNTDNWIQIIQFFINDYSESFKQDIYKYASGTKLCNPHDIFKLTIKICKETDSIVDSCTIQTLIIGIQIYKYLKEAGINNGNNLKNDGYRMYRERYLDLLNIYTTYDSFHEFSKYMKDKLGTLDMDVTDLFDVINDNETITDELTKLLKFD